VTTTLPVILAAVGSAYAIHVLENVFSNAAEGKTGKAGMNDAFDRVSLPVIMAGFTTIAAFMSLCASQIVPLKQVGLLSGFGLFVALSISLTFLPAVLSIFQRMGMECIPHHHTKKDIIGPLLRWFSSVSLMRSSLILGIGGGVLVLAAIGLLFVKSDLDLIKDFRKGCPIRVADEILNEKFGGTSMFSVVFNAESSDDIKNPEVLHQIEALQNRLNEIEGVGKSVSIVDFIKKMNQAMHDGDPAYYVIPESRELVAQYLLLFSFSGGSDDLTSFVNYDYQNAQILLQMKSQSGYLAQDVTDVVEAYKENTARDSKITDIFTTGLSMLAMEFNRLVVQSQLTSFAISLVLIMLITSFAFKSFRLGLYSMLPLIAPVVLNFGIMGATGVTLNAATATIASLAIGIGIDDSIHYLSRYRHEIMMGRDVQQAINIAINTSGRAILYYSLAVTAGFLVLIPSNFVIISQMGILVGLAMVTTTVASVTLLPAILKMFPPKITGKEREKSVIEMPVRLAVQNTYSKALTAMGYVKKQDRLNSRDEIEKEM
jgi:predicted RND superfamily exporter protein